jgi:hypothetical protein
LIDVFEQSIVNHPDSMLTITHSTLHLSAIDSPLSLHTILIIQLISAHLDAIVHVIYQLLHLIDIQQAVRLVELALDEILHTHVQCMHGWMDRWMDER